MAPTAFDRLIGGQRVKNAKFPRVASVTLAACLVLAAPVSGAADTADLILMNGQIYTPGGWKDAVAISRGVIVEVGDAGAVDKLRGAETRVIDLQGDAVLPGLH